MGLVEKGTRKESNELIFNIQWDTTNSNTVLMSNLWRRKKINIEF